jgi:hypothetical protein
MANSTIPNLPIFAGNPSGTEPMETVQSGLSVQIPSQKIADLATIVTPLTKIAMDALVAGSQVSPYKLYLITNAVSNTRRLLVKGETTTTLEDTAIDMSTGEIGTYVLSTNIFTATSGGATNLGYTPSSTDGTVTSSTGTDATLPLADGTNAGLLKPAKFTVLENANQASGYPATDINNEIVSTYYNENDSRANIITMMGFGELVGSKFYQVNDADGGTRTLQVCAENALILHNFAIDVQTGETGDYDINTDVFTPIVVSGTPTLQQVTDVGATTTVGITVDNGTESVVIKHDQIKIVNALGADAVISSPTLATTTTFEIPNKAGGTETFAMMSDVTGGGGDVVGPASAVDNNIATFDGTTGKLIQDGGTTIADINTNAVDRITVKLSQSINKGQAVYISGANGTNILVSKSDNTTEATSSKTLGLLETTGATNAIVNVITSGLIDGIDTSAATVGDAVWLGTAGNLLFGLANKPYAPAHLVYIGVVSRVSATVGEIIVKVQNGFELKEIHDVFAQSPIAKDGLFYDSTTSLWKARQVSADDINANVSNTEFGYLDGVSSSIQTQINGKQATLTNPVTGTGTNNEIAAFNSTGSTITSLAVATYPSLTELSYVKGVTSAIQTQINTKVTAFASATDGTASSGTTSTISVSVLIPANTFALDDVIRINHRVRATGTAGIRETRVYANTTSSLTGAILMSTSSLGATILGANNQRYLAIKNATTNTEVITATTSLLSDYNSVATSVSTLAINWTVDQYIIFQVNAANAADSIRATMYSIEKL